MAKNVVRVNGRGGESMWTSDGELSFRTSGKVHTIEDGHLRDLSIVTAEEARKVVEETELVPFGAWTSEMKSSKGKYEYLVARDDQCVWVMEISKNQSPHAYDFIKAVNSSGEIAKKEYKLYAAIQTPLGGVLAIGTIACIALALYFTYYAQMSVVGILFGVAAIVMFVNVK